MVRDDSSSMTPRQRSDTSARSPAAADERPRRGPARIAAVWGAGLTAVAFGASLDGGFVWDDLPTLVHEHAWRGFSVDRLRWMVQYVEFGHWQPLTWMSLALDHARTGMNPRGYHTTNLVLHALNGFLVYVVALALMRQVPTCRRTTAGRLHWGALLAATLFVAHPMRVESVAWITERRDLLSSAFLLGAFLLWLRSRRGEELSRGAYFGALALYAASLASKAWGITFPAVLVVVAAWPLGRLRRDTWRREAVLLAPFAVLGAATAVIAVVAQRSSGATDIAVEFEPAQRLAVAAFGLVYYPLRWLLPVRLSPFYLLDPALPAVSARSLTCAVLLLATVVMCWRWRNRYPAVAPTLLVYAIIVSPVLGLVQSGSQEVADRYAYLATIPLGMLVGGAWACFRGGHRALPSFAPAVLFGVLLVLGSRAYVPTWKDDIALWTRVIAIEPRNHLGHLNRGLARMGRGDHSGAQQDLTTAAQLAPDAPEPRTNLGYLAAVARPPDLPGALAHLDAALEIDPGYGPARANRAGLMLAMQRPVDALTDIDAAIALDGGSPEEHLARAKILTALERSEDAAEAARAALAGAPRGTPTAQEAQRVLSSLRPAAPR